MTHDEYNKLCERFEVEIELERMELTKKLQDQRGPILYMGSTRLRKQLRAEWEDVQRKELAEELEYRTKRSELEFFGVFILVDNLISFKVRNELSRIIIRDNFYLFSCPLITRSVTPFS